MKRGLAALVIGKKPDDYESDNEENENEEDTDDSGFDVAASSVMKALESGNVSRFRSALKDAIEICTNS